MKNQQKWWVGIVCFVVLALRSPPVAGYKYAN